MTTLAKTIPSGLWICFVDQLDLRELGFSGVDPEATGRPGYYPSTLLKLYIYGYLNRIQSSRRLERETQRNLELMWLLGRLCPDFKIIADFRRDNGHGIRNVCRQLIVLFRRLNLFSQTIVAIDGSKFKAVNAHDAPLFLLFSFMRRFFHHQNRRCKKHHSYPYGFVAQIRHGQCLS